MSAEFLGYKLKIANIYFYKICYVEFLTGFGLHFMKIYQTIEQKLKESLSPIVLKIENESYKHAVPIDSETHFKLVVVSMSFENKPLIKRHQLIYGLLAYELKHSIHALALHTYTPEEWDSDSKVSETPNCMSGGR
jgi:BolA protein|tara:strand:+ start:42 stop:449 length:408 start_codon:yes stop_codon:yes gene_type:complete